MAAAVVLLLGIPRCSVQAQDSGLPAVSPGVQSTDSVSMNQPVRQDLQTDEIPEWHSMITNLPGDWAMCGERCIAPEGLRTMVGIGMLTGFLIAWDGSTYRFTRNGVERHAWARSGANVIEHAGNGGIHLGIAASFALGGLIADDSRALRTASQAVEGLLASGIIVQVLKHMTGRESPAEASADGGKWRFFPGLKTYNRNQARYYAFPSGHIATTMTTVTIIADNYPELGWIRPVGYTLVGLVGASLVGVRYHWYSDLPLGVAIGYTVGTIVAGRDRQGSRTEGATVRSPLTLQPSVGPVGAGVSLEYSF